MRPSFFHFLLTLLVLSTSLSFAAHAGSFARRNDTKKDHLHLFRWDLVRTVPVDAAQWQALIIWRTVKPQETLRFPQGL